MRFHEKVTTNLGASALASGDGLQADRVRHAGTILRRGYHLERFSVCSCLDSVHAVDGQINEKGCQPKLSTDGSTCVLDIAWCIFSAP